MCTNDGLPSMNRTPATLAKHWLLVLALALTQFIAGCGGGGSSTGTSVPPTLEEHVLQPAVIDPRVTTATDPHIAIAPISSAVPANKLFVFLPGTGAVPDQYLLILREGANKGFHAIGLNYVNPSAVGVLCDSSADPNCFWDVRREIITGVDLSPLVAVGNADSIVTRLAMAIAYLRDNYPAEGWGQYLSGSTIDWSKVVISGHSQGGGHAGVMTKLYSMSRAAYFSSPADWSTYFDAPATWTSLPDLTPTSRQFGFGHVEDPLVPYDRLLPIWESLGLQEFGSAASVDSSNAPYGGSHMLTTDATPEFGGGSISPFHGATVLDAATPLTTSGVPLFAPVWDYMCFI